MCTYPIVLYYQILYINDRCNASIYYTVIGADPYCIVKCGRSKAETPVKKNTLSPSFNAKVQFFVSNPGSAEVTVEVGASHSLWSSDRVTWLCLLL